MKHARDDYDVIQDCVSARTLANLVLSMEFVSTKGLLARRLARQVLGIDDHGCAPNADVVATNGTVRIIPTDEPVFLIRGQDAVGGDTVRAWANLAEAAGAAPEILRVARDHAAKMDAWPKKKVPDLKEENPR